ncbi:unnamed protein product, partial [Dibothriocephalus latus]
MLRIEVEPLEERSTLFDGLTVSPSRYETAEGGGTPLSSADAITKTSQAPPVDNLGSLKIINSPEEDRTGDAIFPDGLVLPRTEPPFPPTYSTSPKLKDVCTPATDEDVSAELQQFVTVAKKPTKPPSGVVVGDRTPKFQVTY